MTEVWATWKAIFGVRRLILFFILLCIAIVSAIIYKNIKSEFNLKKIVLICAICIVGFIFAWRQPHLSEKAHVLEFGLLGWLAMRDFTKKRQDLLKSILLGFIFVTIIGYLEEGFQILLPWRVGELRDVVTDILSGMLGIILFVASRPKIKSTLLS